MKEPLLSVIIPTYNRKDTLAKCLNALFRQTFPRSEYEIVVVNDGSTDGTQEVMEKLAASVPLELRCYRQEHKGPAAARNLGIKEARGKIALIIGDDIIATAHLLEEHMAYHQQYRQKNISVLGYVTWSPEIKITPFMRWLENGGPYFHYWEIQGKAEVDYRYFYTCNISFKRDFLLENGLFDEDFPYAAWEDIELGYRLEQRGHRIFYNPRAIAYHHHQLDLNSVCQRAILVGKSARIFYSKAPELLPKNTQMKSKLKAFLGTRYTAALLKTVAEMTGNIKLADLAIRAYRYWGFKSIGIISSP